MNDAVCDNDKTLAGLLGASPYFDALVADCDRLVANELQGRGMTVRTAVSMVKKLKPSIVERTVRELMPDFLVALEPCHADFKASAKPDADFGDYLAARDTRVVDAVLEVADHRAERVGSRPIRSAYARVRGRAAGEIRSVVPELARIIARHRRRALAG